MRRNLSISFEEAFIERLDLERGTISRGRWIEGERAIAPNTTAAEIGSMAANAFGAMVAAENDNLRAARAQPSPLAHPVETLGEIDEHVTVETRKPSSVSPKLSADIKP